MVNIGITAYNIDNLGIIAVMKATGKQNAKVTVENPDEVKETTEQHQQKKTNGNEEQKKDEKK